MIAHRISKVSAKDSFARLGCYVLDLASPQDPKAYERLAGYVVDREGGRGERVLAARVTNCNDEDLELAMREIAMTQDGNVRSKSDKSYHLVISFPEGERPTLEQMRDIEDRLVEAIGFAEHQRISAIHDDTDNLHIHVAINKVHPETFRNVQPYFDHPKLMVACREMEVKHGLRRDNHGLTVEQERQIEAGASIDIERRADDLQQVQGEWADRKRDMEIYGSKESLAGWIQREAKEDLVKAAAEATSWAQLHDALREYGLSVKPHGAGLVIGVPNVAWVKASSVDRSLSVKRLTDRLGLFVPDQTAQERTAGVVIEAEREQQEREANTSPAAGPQTSEEVQERSLVHEVEGDQSRSAESRNQGDGRSAEARPSEPKKAYRAGQVQRSAISKNLYARFERERSTAEDARSAGLSELREQFAAKGRSDEAHWKREKALLKHTYGLAKHERQKRREDLAKAQATSRAARQLAHSQQRAECRKAYPLPTWQRFLEREAARGDEAAVSVLRERIVNQGGAGRDILTAANLTDARNVVYQHLSPQVASNGDLRYVTKDGGIVTDRKGEVRADKTTISSAFLALSIAQDRFGDQPLAIDGSDAFKAAVIEVAAVQGMSVTFADPQLEKARQFAVSRQSVTQPAIDPRQPKDGISGYIESRNALSGLVKDIPEHRQWRPSDAGAAEYAGRRRFADGTEAVLLKDSRGIAVMPVTWRQAAKASRWTTGQLVLTDDRGRFVSTQQKAQAMSQEKTRDGRGQGRGR